MGAAAGNGRGAGGTALGAGAAGMAAATGASARCAGAACRVRERSMVTATEEGCEGGSACGNGFGVGTAGVMPSAKPIVVALALGREVILGAGVAGCGWVGLAAAGAGAETAAGCADFAACCSWGVPFSNCHQSRADRPITPTLAKARIFQNLSLAACVVSLGAALSSDVGVFFKPFEPIAAIEYARGAIEMVANGVALFRAACMMRSRVAALGASGKPSGNMALA